LLTDAGVALALMLFTLGPALVTGLMVMHKPGDTTGYLERTGLPAGAAWWLLTALIVAGLLIRQHRPLVALASPGSAPSATW
jgi:hypothetical protein